MQSIRSETVSERLRFKEPACIRRQSRRRIDNIIKTDEKRNRTQKSREEIQILYSDVDKLSSFYMAIYVNMYYNTNVVSIMREKHSHSKLACEYAIVVKI